MNILWRTWLKMLLAVGLVVGCNTLAPALAAVAAPVVTTQDGDCHHSDRKSAPGMTICKASCLAVAAAPVEMILAPTLKPPLVASVARVLHPLAYSPETPPPRA